MGFIGLVVGVLGFACGMSPAQTNLSPATPAANTLGGRVPDRYLLIFDTSAAMKQRVRGVEQAARALITSGMYGQARRGDTIGLWTFDNELHAGEFPLQVWKPEARDEIAARVVGFLKGRVYRGKSRFDAVLPALQQLIADSPRLTIILFSDGNTPLQGLPFDTEVNAVYAENQRAMQKARMPFLTVLRAQHGRVFAATVGMAPWPVDFPSYPVEPADTKLAGNQPPEPARAKPAAPASPPPKIAAPIILDMSKSRSGRTDAAPEMAADSSGEATHAATRSSPQPEPDRLIQKTDAEAGHRTPTEPVKPIMSETPPPAQVRQQASRQGEPVNAVAPGQPTTLQPEAAIPQPPGLPAQLAGPPTAKSAEKAASAQEPAQVATGSSPVEQRPGTTARPTGATPATPAQAASVVKWPLLIASLFLTAAAVLLVILLLRERSHRGASFITRSMERDRK